MKILIIYAHPNIAGHCSTILKNVEKELKDRKAEYEVLDLYKMKFDPILRENEFYIAGQKKEDKKIKAIQNKILATDKLIFIYPIWWNSFPAILKGFTDRVFSSGYAFRYVKQFGIFRPVGLLKGKKALIFHTSGSPTFLFRFFLMSRGSKILKNDTLKFCGIKAKAFHYGKALKLTPKAEVKLAKLARKGVRWLC